MKFRKENVSRQTLRVRARILYLKKSCERCGAKKSKGRKGLHIHHKDRNWRNNEPENLETLCATCHLKHHHESEYNFNNVITEKIPCRICGKPYSKNSRADLCSTHRDNMHRLGVPVPPPRIRVPCIICKKPWDPLKSRGDLCNAHRLCKKRYPAKFASLLAHINK